MRRHKRVLPIDPVESAALAALRYVRDTARGIARLRRGRGFSYVDPAGRRLRDREALRRIRSLAIPPAWRDVWICPIAEGHLQAVGYDARGRKQYRYHPLYRSVRNLTKFSRMPEFAAALPEMRRKLREHLSLEGLQREKVLAAVVRVLEETAIRIGNEESATENHTFGLTTLRNQHVNVDGWTIRFHFTGKSGVKHDVEFSDRRLARIVKQCHDLPGYNLFEYVDESGELRSVDSADVNAYLKEISGQDFSAKDFRTWNGTVYCAVALAEIGEFSSVTEAKKNIVTAVKATARRLGNRPATCRAYYVHPAIPEAYMEGVLVPAMRSPEAADAGSTGLAPEELAVLAITTKYHRDTPDPIASLTSAA